MKFRVARHWPLAPSARRVALGLALAVLLLPGALAELGPGEGRVRSPEPPIVQGALRAWGHEGVLSLGGAWGPDPAQLAVGAEGATVEIIKVSMRVIPTAAGRVTHSPDYEVTTHLVEQANFTISPLPGFRLLAYPSTPGSANLSADLGEIPPTRLSALPAPFYYQYRMHGERGERPYYYHYEGARDAFPLVAQGGEGLSGDRLRLALSGQLTLFAVGAELTVSSPAGVERFRLSESDHDVRAPLTRAPVQRVENYSFALIHAHGADLALDASQRHDARLVMAHPTFELRGALALAGVSGHLRAGEDVSRFDGEILWMEGDVLLRPLAPRRDSLPVEPGLEEEPSWEYAVEGDFASVRVDGRTVYRDAFEAPGAVAAAAVLVAIALVFRRFWDVLGILVGFYTRLNASDIAKNATRALLLRLVAEHPGIRLRELQRRAEMGWGRLHYHVQVLARNRCVRLDRKGKHVFVYPSRAGEPPRDAILRVSGAAADVYAVLQSEGSATQAELEGRLRISRQLVSYHLRRLQEWGLVEALAGWPRRYVATAGAGGGDAAGLGRLASPLGGRARAWREGRDPEAERR